MADLKKITLPSGTTYNIVDQGARDLIAALEGSTAWIGVTTTPLTDGSTTNPIVVAGETITAKKGNMVAYGKAEFVFDGTKWQEFGDLSTLGDLAYKDSATGSYTPAGAVSQPTFTGTEHEFNLHLPVYTKQWSQSFTGTSGSVSADFTPEGTVSKPTFTGTKGTVSASYTPAGSVSKPTFEGTEGDISASFTPAGTVSKPTFTGTEGNISASFTPAGTVSKPAVNVSHATDTIAVLSEEGTLPSATMPTLTMNVANETLTFGWTPGTFDPGTLPEYTEFEAVTGVSAELAAAPTFTGTAGTATGKFTPAGTVSQPTFTGTSGTATGKFTPEGTVSKPTFTGTAGTASGSFTPAGTVSQPTFTGTAGTATGTFTPAGKIGAPSAGSFEAAGTVTYTPEGTVSQPTFTGTGATIEVD